MGRILTSQKMSLNFIQTWRVSYAGQPTNWPVSGARPRDIPQLIYRQKREIYDLTTDRWSIDRESGFVQRINPNSLLIFHGNSSHILRK